MGMLQEFKEFALKGNVVDMAVGVVIGGAFGKIVSSLVQDIIMPIVGKITGGVDFSSLKYEIQAAVPASGEGENAVAAVEAVTINYGVFINTAIDFLIIAAAIFMAVKAMNSLKKKQEDAPKPPAEEIVLLREIRDSLAK
ncbi:MAG: large-conductance mechanosensitive channel protein MscL [Planctomycetales bacterium]|nr:large-conductance mechanosensitive channel protein MscL [Planctomycetales bacterium]